MATREEVLQRLSLVQSQQLLQYMPDEVIFDLAARIFHLPAENRVLAAINADPVVSGTENRKGRPSDRAKRPLNAFMAFRSYYLKIFPDVQQKNASGFLTILWSKDPFRNKWALIAKVYSFVRDEVGKDRVSLSIFLSIACPEMNIIEPAAYLRELKWTITDERDGTAKLFRDKKATAGSLSEINQGDYPSTEVELLSKMIKAGYFADQGAELLARMASNQNAIIAPRNSPVTASKKIAMQHAVRGTPEQLAKELLGDAYDENSVGALGIPVHAVEDCNHDLAHISMPREFQNPLMHYDYAATQHLIGWPSTPFDLERVNDTDAFNINNPLEYDQYMGFPEIEGSHPSSFQAPPPVIDPTAQYQMPF